MEQKLQTISINILSRQFQIKCAENEAATLQQIAQKLNHHALAIKQSGKVVGYEGIIVMAALTLCHEHIATESQGHSALENISSGLNSLIKRIDSELNNGLILEVKAAQ